MDKRKNILDMLIPYFEQDNRYHLLVCDSGFGAIDKLSKLFPNRIKNMGIQEQNTVSVAQGMAIEGLKPIVFSITQFLAMRSIEQVRNTVMQDLDVKFIGTGSSNYFKFLGDSHCCDDKDISFMGLAGVRVFDSFQEDINFSYLLDQFLNYEKASYLRV
jgi:transketolase